MLCLFPLIPCHLLTLQTLQDIEVRLLATPDSVSPSVLLGYHFVVLGGEFFSTKGREVALEARL